MNRNITERKQAEEALSRSEASFRSLVEGAPYGIYRATMNGQLLQVNSALQRILGYESAQELLAADLGTQVFRHQAEYQRMNELFANAQGMKDNLNSMVSEMQKMLPRLLGEDIAVSMSLEPELGNVQADPSQIEQVIMNLAVNARDAMPTGGKLEIRTANVELDQAYTRDHPGSKAGHYVMMAIADTGTGMDAETIAHIFEPFFTTKEIGKGTGLGLATVYGVVKQSNGYVWVDSAPGTGATFQVYLPRHWGGENVTAAKPMPDSLGKHQGTKTILLVEDAEPLRKLAQSFLEGNGFRVLSASCGEEALEVAARHSGILNLLLTDVVMPGMNGRLLAEQLNEVVKKRQYIHRSEVRVRLRVSLKLKGTDAHGNQFEESAFTENVSLSGFLCACATHIQLHSILEVYVSAGRDEYVGKAEVVHADGNPAPPHRYGCRFREKVGPWVLQ